ncbi:MAG: hypothetical protein AB7R89_00355 [Dehalococcoidia bacterium]
MSTIWPVTDVLETRWQALRALDDVVRRSLVAAAARWRIPECPMIERTDYHCIYPRTPAFGGHWTLFGTSLTNALHLTATVTVALEFDGDRPVDLWVSGARDVAAGGCTVEALAEALDQCDGPLRQITPIAIGAWANTRPQLPGSEPDMDSPPMFALN